jgi:hypothetical protein
MGKIDIKNDCLVCPRHKTGHTERCGKELVGRASLRWIGEDVSCNQGMRNATGFVCALLSLDRECRVRLVTRDLLKGRQRQPKTGPRTPPKRGRTPFLTPCLVPIRRSTIHIGVPVLLPHSAPPVAVEMRGQGAFQAQPKHGPCKSNWKPGLKPGHMVGLIELSAPRDFSMLDCQWWLSPELFTKVGS